MARPLKQLIGNQHALGDSAIDASYGSVAEGWFQAVACDRLELPLRIARLKKLLVALHDNERALVARTGGQLCSCHEQAHGALLSACREASAFEPHDWRKAQSLLRHQFRKLFREHMICMDSIMVLAARIADQDGRLCRPCCGV